MQPEFINLDSTEFQYKAANGIYKLIPYYQKLSPELSAEDFKSSRFIIHKHVITGQWQLTDVYAYPSSRIVKAFPVTDENEKMKFKTNLCIPLYQTVQRQETAIEILQKKVKTKDDTIEFLTTQNDVLLDTSSTIKDTAAYAMYHGKLKIQNERIKMLQEKMRLMQTEMNFQKTQLWEEQKTLKQNLSTTTFQQKETQTKLSECELEIQELTALLKTEQLK
jgi:hypothetical protein